VDRTALNGAFVSLLNDHRGAIHRVCRTYADTADEREELAQEVVYQLWRAYPSYRGAAAPLTWVYRIALNAAFSALRKRARRPAHTPLDEASQVPAAAPRPDDRAELLYRAIRRLGDVERALVACHLDGLSYKETAEVLGISEVNVGVRLTRTKARLKEIVQEME
jgi:RNA polymerase sigma factor (sigma-70 family)